MDAYERLRPIANDSPCDCATVEQLLLVDILSPNPVRCFQCKGYVDPEGLKLSERQVDSVVSWKRVFGALYRLWLDSGEYETWAKQQLLRSDGRVNVLGMAARAALAETRPTFYWWFHDTDDPAVVSCPWCGGAVVSAARHGTNQCNSCCVVV